MSRTALDLTPEELQHYHPYREPADLLSETQWQQAWDIARAAAQLLRERFGATRVVIFGSLAHRRWFCPSSDIDLVAWGIPSDQYYRAVAVVTGLSADFKVDLVDPDSCRASLRRVIAQEGIEI